MKKLFLIIGFVGLSLVFTMASEAADIEAVTEDNTVNSGFSVKEGTGSTTLMRVRGDGKVGIGTTSPQETFQVGEYTAGVGNVRVTGDDVAGYWATEANPRWELNRDMGGGGLAGIGFGPGGATAYDTKIYRSSAYNLQTTATGLYKDVATSSLNVGGGTTYNDGGGIKLIGDSMASTTGAELYLMSGRTFEIMQNSGAWPRTLKAWGGGGVYITDDTGASTDPGAGNLAVEGTASMAGFQLGTSTTAGNVLTANASGVGTWAAPWVAKLILASDISTGANTTPVNLTGMVFTFEANSNYVIDMYMIQQSAAATTGFGYLIDTSVAVTSVLCGHVNQLANTGTLTGSHSIGDALATGVSSGLPTAGTNVYAYGSGLLISTTNGGTAQFMVRSETTAVTTCKAGSMIRVMKMN